LEETAIAAVTVLQFQIDVGCHSLDCCLIWQQGAAVTMQPDDNARPHGQLEILLLPVAITSPCCHVLASRIKVDTNLLLLLVRETGLVINAQCVHIAYSLLEELSGDDSSTIWSKPGYSGRLSLNFSAMALLH
jgi:hypothetical protein